MVYHISSIFSGYFESSSSSIVILLESTILVNLCYIDINLYLLLKQLCSTELYSNLKFLMNIDQRR